MLTEELPEHSLLGKEVNYPLCMMTEQLCSPASTSPLESRPMLCSLGVLQARHRGQVWEIGQGRCVADETARGSSRPQAVL